MVRASEVLRAVRTKSVILEALVLLAREDGPSGECRPVSIAKRRVEAYPGL